MPIPREHKILGEATSDRLAIIGIAVPHENPLSHHLPYWNCSQAKMTDRLYGGGSLNGGRVGAGSVGSTASSSLPATVSGVTEAPAGNHLTPMHNAAVSAATAAVSAGANDTAAPDGGRFGNAAASPPPAAWTPKSLLCVKRAVEYRWPNDGLWYRCEVVSISPGVNGKGETVELAYLPPKNAKTQRVKIYTEKLEVAELLADGDIAKPGKHLDWN